MLRGRHGNEADLIINRAVQLARTPGIAARESGAGRGGVNTREDITTMPDEDGNTTHAFFLDVDFLDDESAMLI